MSDKKKMDTDDWMGLLGDAEKADVMKTRIAQEAATERARIEAVEQTKRTLINNDGHQIVRGLFVVGLAAVMIAAIAAWSSSNDPKLPTGAAPASSHS